MFSPITRGRRRTGHREAAVGLPAAEKGLKAGKRHNLFPPKTTRKHTDRTFGAKRRVWIPNKKKLVCAHVLAHHPRQASDRPQRGRGRPAGCREGFEGG